MSHNSLNHFQLEARDQETEQLLSSELSAAQQQLASCQHSLAELTASKAALTAEVNQLKDLLDMAGEDELSLQEVAAQKEIIITRDREIEALHRALHHRAAQLDQLAPVLIARAPHGHTRAHRGAARLGGQGHGRLEGQQGRGV